MTKYRNPERVANIVARARELAAEGKGRVSERGWGQIGEAFSLAYYIQAAR